MPDTSGTDYRTQHTKSTIVLNDLDVDARRLGYWHNAGYFTLEGEDFAQTFRLDREPDPAFMPFYAELVRIDRAVRRPEGELRDMSKQLLARHLSRRPRTNPVVRFGERFAADLPRLREQGLSYYHAWAFATVRQLGSAAELMACYLRWLDASAYAAAAEQYDAISAGAKTFILKAARGVMSKKPFDPAPQIAEWAAAWDRAMAALEERPA